MDQPFDTDYYFEYLNANRVQIKAQTDEMLFELQNKFSYERKIFGTFGRFSQSAVYSCISPTFSIKKGLTLEIAKFLKNHGKTFSIDPRLRELLQPKCHFVSDELIQPSSKFKYRDYQEQAIRNVKAFGRGILSSPTSSGKSLILFGICSNILEYGERTLIIVPRIQLVSQFYKEWTVEYGYKGIAMYSTKCPVLDSNAKVVITNYQFLASRSNAGRKDLELIKNGNFKAVIIDECHTIGESGSWLSNFLQKLNCKYALGCTGTVPDDKAKRWNVIGNLGPVIFVKHIHELQENNQIAKVNIKCFRFVHNLKQPSELPWRVNGQLLIDKDTGAGLDTTGMYRAEYKYLEHHNFCNNKILRLVESLSGNTVVLVDHIEHANYMFDHCRNENKFLIDGSRKLEYRNKISSLLDAKDGKAYVIIAVSSCFSTGISIKNLQNLVLCSHGKALTKIIQSVGRVLRKLKPDGEEEYGNLYDFSHNQLFAKKHFKTRCSLYKKFYCLDVSKTYLNIAVPELTQNIKEEVADIKKI